MRAEHEVTQLAGKPHHAERRAHALRPVHAPRVDVASEQLADDGVLLRTGDKPQLIVHAAAQQCEGERVDGADHGRRRRIILEPARDLAAQQRARFLGGCDDEDARRIRTGLDARDDGIDEQARHPRARGSRHTPRAALRQVKAPFAVRRGSHGSGDEPHLRRGRQQHASAHRAGWVIRVHTGPTFPALRTLRVAADNLNLSQCATHPRHEKILHL